MKTLAPGLSLHVPEYNENKMKNSTIEKSRSLIDSVTPGFKFIDFGKFSNFATVNIDRKLIAHIVFDASWQMFKKNWSAFTKSTRNHYIQRQEQFMQISRQGIVSFIK